MPTVNERRSRPLAEIVRRVSGGRFLVVGRAGMDLNAMPPGARSEDAETFLPTLGGSAANIAVALVRHGLHASLLTAVSDDSVGRFCLKQLASFGVGVQDVQTVGGAARTSLAAVETRLDDKHVVIYRNGAADFQVTNDHVRAVDFDRHDALVLTGTVLASEPSRSASFLALEMARAKAVPTIIDIDYRPYSWTSPEEAAAIYRKAAAWCDVVIGNEEEFAVLAGAPVDGLDTARRLAIESAALVVYKRGPLGTITLLAEHELITGVFPVSAIKPSGAGDAFLGALLAGLAHGRDLGESVLRGSAAAAMVVAAVGCAPAMPTAAELDAFLASRGGAADIPSGPAQRSG